MNKKLKFLAFIFVINLLLINNVYGAEVVDTEFTEDYKKWEELSDKDKKKYIQPMPYSSTYVSRRTTKNNAKTRSNLPSRYFLKDDIELKVRDQMSTGSCWAFTATNLLSTNLEKIGKENSFKLFSVRHMEYSTALTFSDGPNLKAFNRQVGEGANPYIGLCHVISGEGPVLEKDMPFENNENIIPLASIQNKKIAAKVNEFIDFPSLYKSEENGTIKYNNGYETTSDNYKEYNENEVTEIRNKIKNHIKKYGAVSAFTYLNGSKYFEKATNKGGKNYYNYDDTGVNHAITIVGWDDNYSRNNFKSTHLPEHDGAYIVLNSHGTGYYDNGYMYVSYDDRLIEVAAYGVVETTNKDYNNIYQHDELGKSADLKIDNENTSTMVNIFDRKSDSSLNKEYIKEISFFVSDSQKVQIYLNKENDDKDNMTLLKSYDSLEEGYHTYKLEEPIEITGSKFAVGVKYTNPNGDAVLPMEFNFQTNNVSSNFWDAVKGEVGQSYFTEGGTWKDLNEEFRYANFNVKAFTKVESKKNGWVKDNDNTYYYINDEKQTGIAEIEGNKYYFNNEGIMQVGWQEIEGKKYYFRHTNGIMQTGFRTISGDLYYFGEDGIMKTGIVEIEGKKYYFGTDGKSEGGWQEIEGKKYYFRHTTGEMQTGFRKIYDDMYYFGEDGIMKTGIVEIEENKYYFNNEGIMQVGWQEIEGKKYYFRHTNGIMQKGFRTISGDLYYFGEDGIMRTGWQEIEGKNYNFGTDGKLITN